MTRDMRRRWKLASVAALVTALGTGVAFSQHADAVPGMDAARATAAPTKITAVSVSPSAVEVHGLDLATVVVSVTLTSEYGDPEGVALTRTTRTAWDPSAPGLLSGALVRTTGTTGNGTYQAKVLVPSSAHGSWRVSEIYFGSMVESADPRDSGVADALLKVTGRHRPRMRLTLSPQPLPYPQRALTVSARLSYDDTRRPIVGRWVFFAQEEGCAENFGQSAKARTDSLGAARWRTTTVQEDFVVLNCAWMPLPVRSALTDGSLFYTAAGEFPLIGTRTTAAPSKASVKRGTPVVVNGHAFAVVPVAGNRVVLKRLVGGHWRTVSVARVRSSGRFTLHASPPKGRNSYRVVLSGSGKVLGSRSHVFAITGR